MASQAADVDTQCPVCHEDFTDAKRLPCFHVACRKCILSVLLAGGQGGCPLCRVPIMNTPTSTFQYGQETPASVVDKLPTYSPPNSHGELSTRSVCGVCDVPSVAATSFCLDCRVKLCTSCTKVHGKLPATRNHRLEDLSIDKESKVAQQIQELDKNIAEVQTHFSRQRSEVSDTFDRLKELLDNRCQAVLAQLQKGEDDVISPKQAQKAALEKQKASLAVHAGSAERLALSTPDPNRTRDASRDDTLVSVRWQSGMIPRLEHAIETLGQVASQTPKAEGVQPCIVCGLKPKPTKSAAAKSQSPKSAATKSQPTKSTAAKPEPAKATAVKQQPVRPEPARPEAATPEDGKGKPTLRDGDRVRRGSDWCYDNQDGTPPGLGTVTRLTDWNGLPGWVRVRWDAGTQGYYRMGQSGCYDLELA